MGMTLVTVDNTALRGQGNRCGLFDEAQIVSYCPRRLDASVFLADAVATTP
jgi:hypothetical protein